LGQINEKRGPKATGVMVNEAGGNVFSLKRTLAALEFVKTAAFNEFMLLHVNRDTRILLGHPRDPTKEPVCSFFLDES
jgi:hypothetical protein